jgi:kynureninase
MDDLLLWRREFPILENSTYMISNSLGAMPYGAETGLLEYARLWKEEGVESWSVWFPKIQEVCDLFGGIIGAGAGEVALVPNVTFASAQIASALDFTGRRNKVVLSDLHFTSIGYLWKGWEKYGARVELVRSADGIGVDAEALIAAIDDETMIVPLSHVYFRSGYVQDLDAIIRAAHARGALVFVDAYQSAGIVPIDVRKSDIDILATGCLKWLCGGPGAAFLYVRPDLRAKLEPAIRGWLGHRDPFGFDFDTFEFHEGAQRFLTSSPQMPALYAAEAGLKIIAQVGVDLIRTKSLQLTAKIIDMADEYSLTVNSPRDDARRGGAITVDCGNAEAVSRALIHHHIIVDYRKGAGIRIAPHFYTSDDEVDRAIETIDEALTTGGWRDYESARPLVT